MTKKLSDYITCYLESIGVSHLFMISGGGAMHLNDSFGRSKKIQYICNHHEQASAIAAEGYARATGKIAVVCVTTGPGSTNAITGVIGQWLDSVPVLYISGQVKQETYSKTYKELPLRQLGDQEINIVDIVKPITKYAITIQNPLEIKQQLDKAIYLATHGRPGPVWIDLPIDIQGAIIDDTTQLKSWQPESKYENPISQDLSLKISQVITLLKQSKCPVILGGNGVRSGGATELFHHVINKINAPVVSTFNGNDIIPTDHPLSIGKMGTIGDRAGNFAVQNADLYLSIGSRNNIRQISYNWNETAKNAKKIIVDIDEAELNKPSFQPDMAIHADASLFLKLLLKQLDDNELPNYSNWLNWCIKRKQEYPVILPDYQKEKNLIHPYYFVQQLSEQLNDDDIIVTGNGTASVVYFQAGLVKRNQRIIWNSGCASMGYDLPAAIGAAIAHNGSKRIICLAGDGSLQMNIQELQTIKTYALPIKLFYLDNAGYSSIKQTQNSYFQGRHVACDSSSGVQFPDISKIATAFELNYACIDSHHLLKETIKKHLSDLKATIIHTKLNPEIPFRPKLASKKLPNGQIVSCSLENMFPFLDHTELQQNQYGDLT